MFRRPVLPLLAASAMLASAPLATAHASSFRPLPKLQKAPRDDGSTDWLSTINYWRAAAGLQPVTDNPAWDQGIENHLIYLANTPASYETGQYASAHTENPASPYYTASGATEGGSSDLDFGVDTAEDAIDDWLAAPFHAIGMLRPNLTQVAFALDAKSSSAGLDVIQGLVYGGTQTQTAPVLYPGPGSTTTLTSFDGGEEPNPTETCGWQGKTVGLPLIVLLPSSPATAVTASLSGPAGTESTANGDLCVVDEYTYHSSDTVYGPTGLEILQDDNAMLLIPRLPLTSGTYSASLSQPGQADIDWSFAASAASSENSTSGGTRGGNQPSTGKGHTKVSLTIAAKSRGARWTLRVSSSASARGRITVTVARLESGGHTAKQRTIGHSTRSAASFTVKLAKGRWRIRAVFTGSGNSGATGSATRVVTVR